MREPTARHGRQEVRMVWALRDPALNSDVGRSGTGEQPWPELQPLVRIERERTLRRRGRATWVGKFSWPAPVLRNAWGRAAAGAAGTLTIVDR